MTQTVLALVGLPGSGKSTVGRQLARRLQLNFIDSDHAIEQRLGCSIREYFEVEGEERFRDIETEVIQDLLAADFGVVSTGGGSVLRPKNRELLRAKAKVFYLRASPDEVFKRLKYDQNRPLLQVADPLARLRELYRVRDPLYRETAHHVVETGRPKITNMVHNIIAQLEQDHLTEQTPCLPETSEDAPSNPLMASSTPWGER
jgi:shikimate kinase